MNPLRFALDGVITTWEPLERRLQISGETCWVAPEVTVSGVAKGVRALAIGHREDLNRPPARHGAQAGLTVVTKGGTQVLGHQTGS